MDRQQITQQLMSWWDAGHDSFPWRQTSDPYAIWVSEVMLQQTQVATVVPYFQRWMDRFPTVSALAAVPLDEVLKLWQGLGYYRRAHNLQSAAQELVDKHGGELPADMEALQALPGIGRYTAGAIASIAFTLPAAVLDGNVIRVLARLTDLADDVTKSPARRHLWQLAESLVDHSRPGDHNQALMELGRKICQPRRPTCHLCPLVTLCQAHAAGTQLERPVRPPRKRIPHYPVTAGVIWRENKVLIAQRPLDGMLGGLWEFPGGKQQAGESLIDCLRREIREELGFEIEVGAPLITVEHAYTHFRISLHAFCCQHLEGEPQPLRVADLRWVPLDQLADYPFPVTDQKIIAALLADLPK